MKKDREALTTTSEFIEKIISASDKKTAETLVSAIEKTVLLQARKTDAQHFDTGLQSFACSGGQQCSGGVDSGTDSSCKVQTCPRLACDSHDCGTVSCGAVV